MLRIILPKGTVFTDLNQWQLKKIACHLNSTPWKRLNGTTPYQLALENHGQNVLNALQLTPVLSDDVTLTFKLLKK